MRLRTFETEREARKVARWFDYARACHGLPPLEVEQDAGGWHVVNPDVHAKPGAWRKPGSDETAELADS